MLPDAEPGDDPATPSLPIPEIRDYQRINAELKALLDRGHRRVRLEGAEGQRLLVSGLVGAWEAVVEVEGRTGPELAAGLDAPGLVVVARGSTADGAASSLRAGRVVILGDAGDAPGVGLVGGLLVLAGSAGHRAGLGQVGGTIAMLGSTGRLAADRQAGGWFFAPRGKLGSHPGRGRRGGRLVEWTGGGPLDPEAADAWRSVVAFASAWVEPASLRRP